MTRRGVPVVVSAPSGAGKTTLCRRVMTQLSGIEFSISHTTRGPRPNERDGVDYNFVQPDAFEAMVADDAFLEWAHVHDRRYGTARGPVMERLDAGLDVFFDIDYQGGRQIADRVEDTVLIFVLPPSMAVLERRLRDRKSDSEEQITKRLAVARQEIEASRFYRYWIINDDLDRAVDELKSIVVAERIKRVDTSAMIETFMGDSQP